ncbi:MAG: ankyrin repeat domain-containing protein [Wolbachia endosymbiont of Polyergus mexicanus]|uniref:Ankyrin repeat domain-containing protein n=1 Tax=Wolbachia endosymbiont of Polyergus mexicanus TaxID=3171167 RepID=A0AAU7YKB4_9RICK
MPIEKEKFFEIICNVSESKGLNKDNLLQKIKGELHQKDYAEYDKFKRNFSKEHQFSIKISDKIEGWTLLHLAAACNNLLTVELLLKKKASVKTRVKDGSNDGPTALDIAKSNGNQEIVQLLSDANANPKLEKNKDKTSRDIITKANEIPEDLVVKGNNATAALENGNKRTSLNSTDESSDSTVDEQSCVSVKSRIEEIESLKKPNATYSDKRILTDESDSEDSGLELGLETASNTSSRSEINHDGANHVEENVDNQTLENALRSQKEENQSLKQKIQDLKSKNATLKGELEKTKKNEVPLEKAQKELTELRSYITGHETKLEVLEKLNEEDQSLKQKIQDLESKNATLKNKLDKTETKAKALLEKTQKELEESKSCIAGHETKLKQFNKENESLRQEIKNLKNENTTLKGELGKAKTKTNEVSLEKVEKRQFSPKVACASLAAMLAVGAALSIASGLSALLIVAASVVSALIAGGITYTISKPIAPDTELKEVDIQGSAQHGVCKT